MRLCACLMNHTHDLRSRRHNDDGRVNEFQESWWYDQTMKHNQVPIKVCSTPTRSRYVYYCSTDMTLLLLSSVDDASYLMLFCLRIINFLKSRLCGRHEFVTGDLFMQISFPFCPRAPRVVFILSSNNFFYATRTKIIFFGNWNYGSKDRRLTETWSDK